jgi:hypothetical protein
MWESRSLTTIWSSTPCYKVSYTFFFYFNSVVLVRKRNIPIERPQPVGEVSANFSWRGCRVVSATDPHGRNLRFLDPKPLLFHSSSSAIILTRLSGPRSRPTTSQKIEPGSSGSVARRRFFFLLLGDNRYLVGGGPSKLPDIYPCIWLQGLKKSHERTQVSGFD